MVTEEEIAELMKTPEGRKILDDILGEFSSPAESALVVPPEPAPIGEVPTLPQGSIGASPHGNTGGVDPNSLLGVDPSLAPRTLPQEVDPNMSQMQGATTTQDERLRMINQLTRRPIYKGYGG
jgi:hypothetical protein